VPTIHLPGAVASTNQPIPICKVKPISTVFGLIAFLLLDIAKAMPKITNMPNIPVSLAKISTGHTPNFSFNKGNFI
jgi:hypothetical protein